MEDPTEGEEGSVFVFPVDVKDDRGANNCEGPSRDLIRDGLLTGRALVTGWMLVTIGVVELVEIDEELVEAPIVPEGFLLNAT